MAYVLLRAGNGERASALIEAAFKRPMDLGYVERRRRFFWWKGYIAGEGGSISDMKQAAAEIKAITEGSLNKRAVRYYDHLSGLISLAKGQYAKAAESLDRACALMPHENGPVFSLTEDAIFRYPLALARFKARDLGRARAEFEKITLLTTGRFFTGDLYAKSFYWLGKIAEEQRDKRRAAENYGKFLDLWKDADPGQPEIDDAKARLTALK
jgi:TolA-binding protein